MLCTLFLCNSADISLNRRDINKTIFQLEKAAPIPPLDRLRLHFAHSVPFIFVLYL